MIYWMVPFLPRCAMQAWPMPSCGVRLSVCPSVVFVDSVKTNIFKYFSLSDSHTILVFLYRTSWHYSDGTPTNRGVECRRSRQKSWCFLAIIWLRHMLSTLRTPSVINTVPPDHGKLWQLSLVVSGEVWWWQGTDDRMFMTRSLSIMPKTTERHLIVRSDKSVACVTNNKRPCSTFCTIDSNYWQTRSITLPICDSRATCSLFKFLVGCCKYSYCLSWVYLMSNCPWTLYTTFARRHWLIWVKHMVFLCTMAWLWRM